MFAAVNKPAPLQTVSPVGLKLSREKKTPAHGRGLARKEKAIRKSPSRTSQILVAYRYPFQAGLLT